jgi:hypothetical protein
MNVRPSSISEEAVAEWVRCASAPGGLRGIFEVYQAHFENAKQNVQWAGKLEYRSLLSSEYFMKAEPLCQMQQVALQVEYVELERWGHSMALEWLAVSRWRLGVSG